MRLGEIVREQETSFVFWNVVPIMASVSERYEEAARQWDEPRINEDCLTCPTEITRAARAVKENSSADGQI
jgi:hypothetical protein